jgi:hypothetical protein
MKDENKNDIDHTTSEDRGPADLSFVIDDYRKQLYEMQQYKSQCIQALGPRALNTYSMYKGSQIMELEACGLELEAYCLGLDACYLELAKLGA